ncbi:hypothetical protein RhiJN_02337 [Ceratobasidium sp. AG-Ba]|nr:hypothetical protein RhiJN_02337 [Ceratobasidium sp. AG-Ba]QRW03267.1 hypothetical protein RhiLY_02266 [Ceratobasidium sp. AG-Ba]
MHPSHSIDSKPSAGSSFDVSVKCEDTPSEQQLSEDTNYSSLVNRIGTIDLKDEPIDGAGDENKKCLRRIFETRTYMRVKWLSFGATKTDSPVRQGKPKGSIQIAHYFLQEYYSTSSCCNVVEIYCWSITSETVSWVYLTDPVNGRFIASFDATESFIIGPNECKTNIAEQALYIGGIPADLLTFEEAQRRYRQLDLQKMYSSCDIYLGESMVNTSEDPSMGIFAPSFQLPVPEAPASLQPPLPAQQGQPSIQLSRSESDSCSSTVVLKVPEHLQHEEGVKEYLEDCEHSWKRKGTRIICFHCKAEGPGKKTGRGGRKCKTPKLEGEQTDKRMSSLIRHFLPHFNIKRELLKDVVWSRPLTNWACCS